VRERLLAAFVGLTLLTVMLYGVPRAVVRAEIVNDQARQDVTRTAQMVSELVETRLAAGLPPGDVRLDFLRDRDQVVHRTDGGAQVLAGAADGQGGATASAPVADGGMIEVRRPGDVVREDVVVALRPILLTGLLALVVAVVAAVLLSVRLARPFQLLASRATALGRGEFDVHLPPQPVREAEDIAAALRTSSARVSSMLQRERDFARNASHQLRTPLTGVRLRVEDVAAWPETPDTVRAELGHVLGEVDRLSDTVTALLAYAREERMGDWDDVPLGEVVEAAQQRWGQLAAAQGRRLDVDADTTVVPVPRVAVDQVLDVLVDNALKHGRGTVSVGAAHDERAVRFTVRDEGTAPPGAAGMAVPRRRSTDPVPSDGEGIGLVLCADLATVLGGRLALVQHHPTTFELVLPLARPASH
jgi:signal transduction histidine kinase